MIRTLSFIIWAAVIAVAITLLLAVDGDVSAEAFGWRVDVPAGLALAVALLLAVMLVLATAALKDVAGAPRVLRAQRAAAKRDRGLSALLKGWSAVEAGEAGAAQSHARAAKKALGDSPAATLLAAEAARLAGDDSAAGEALAALANSPDTEFLALRARCGQAMRAGAQDAALGHADRALSLHPKCGWALRAQAELALGRLDFKAAEAAFLAAAKARALDPAAGARAAAAAATAAAYCAHRDGETNGALAGAEMALKSAPGLAPAALLAARAHAARGERRKAEKILLEAFAVAPDEALVEEAERIFAEETPTARAQKMERLADAGGNARPAQLARARTRLLQGDAAAAAVLLTDMLKSSATARPLLLMAEAQALLHGRPAAQNWLIRASGARDTPGAEAYDRLDAEAWRALIRAYRDDARFEPPFVQPAGLSDDEFSLLFAAGATPAEPPEAPRVETAHSEEALDREAAAARGVS